MPLSYFDVLLLTYLSGSILEEEDKSGELGPLHISSKDCDELFHALKLSLQFLPCLWSTRRVYGTQEFYYWQMGSKFQGTGKRITRSRITEVEAIRLIYMNADIWYTVPLSVTVNGEGNFSLASSAIYSRYLPQSPQLSFILIVLRYNWRGTSLDGRPKKEFDTILAKYKTTPEMDFGEQRATNDCEWHLTPQLAYFGMIFKLWREGLEALYSFTHEQVSVMSCN